MALGTVTLWTGKDSAPAAAALTAQTPLRLVKKKWFRNLRMHLTTTVRVQNGSLVPAVLVYQEQAEVRFLVHH